MLAIAGGAIAHFAGVAVCAAGMPFNSVHSYDKGLAPVSGYTDPSTALGDPERFTGEGVFPTVVSVFNPPWRKDEVVSIGEGGQLTLKFDEPIEDDPLNPFGADLIIFGNAGFVDLGGMVPDPGVAFGLDEMIVEVSSDGIDYESLGSFTEGLMPTQGYLDSGAYDTTPGSVESDFNKPVDPALQLSDFKGLDLDGVRDIYDGSGGGTPIDIGPSGFSSVSFVRVSRPNDGDMDTSLNVEIDAITDVHAIPTPGTAALVSLAGLGLLRRHRAPGSGEGVRCIR